MIVLAISYDLLSLNNRIRLLSDAGHMVVPASSRELAMSHLSLGKFDVIAIGATVLPADRETFIRLARQSQPTCRVVAAEADGHQVATADCTIPAFQEEALLDAIGVPVRG